MKLTDLVSETLLSKMFHPLFQGDEELTEIDGSVYVFPSFEVYTSRDTWYRIIANDGNSLISLYHRGDHDNFSYARFCYDTVRLGWQQLEEFSLIIPKSDRFIKTD